MSDSAPGDGARIVVLIDAPQPDAAVLTVAAAIAPDERPRFHGMLIEDANVLRLGTYADAREVTLGDARIRVPEPAALERQLRAAARDAQAWFERAAADLSTAATFEVRRGQPIGELMRGASGAHGLVLGRGSTPTGRFWYRALAQLLAADIGELAFAAAVPAATANVVAVEERAPPEVRRRAEQIAARTRLDIAELPPAAVTAPAGRDGRTGRGRIRYLVLAAESAPPDALQLLLREWNCTIIVVR